MERIELHEIPGFSFGQVQDVAAGTGCTVILCPQGAVTGVDIRGGSPGTRDTAALDPLCNRSVVHAVVLTGGSAFGLDAAGGVMKKLEEEKIGRDVLVTVVPNVCAAVLFDLKFGAMDVRPDGAMGYAACEAALQGGPLQEGNFGAGTGCTVGKIRGAKFAMKGGIGCCAYRQGDLMVGAVVACNAMGDVWDHGQIIAGARNDENTGFANAEEWLIAHGERQLDVFETSSPSYPLLVSLDGCTDWLAADGPAAFARWRDRLERFSAAVADLHNIKVMCFGQDALADHPDFFAHDSGKILLQIGAEGAAFLRASGFEPEMVCGPNVLAMTSPCDNTHALDRLAEVLHHWDDSPSRIAPAPPAHLLPAPGNATCTIAEALLRPARQISMTMADACGETAAEYIWAYPPGVPLVAPGETITPEFLASCRELEAAGTRLHHSRCKDATCIAVL